MKLSVVTALSLIIESVELEEALEGLKLYSTAETLRRRLDAENGDEDGQVFAVVECLRIAVLSGGDSERQLQEAKDRLKLIEIRLLEN